MRKAVVVLTGVILVFLVIVLLQPNTFSVERSTTINAPAETPFTYINDFHNWKLWSPWEEKDPEVNITHSGAERGVGAVYEWSGNEEVGSGKQTITESVAPHLIKIDIFFKVPFEAQNEVTFGLTEDPDAGVSTVTWKIEGEKNFLAKAFGLFFDMDAAVGPDFEKGLANLKRVAESGPPQPSF